MQANPLVVPALIGAAGLFWLGCVLQRRFVSRASRACLWFAGVILAIPGTLYVLYYAHLFDNAAW